MPKMPITCFRCGKCYSTQYNLNRHLKMFHGMNDTEFVCVKCKFFYKYSEVLRQHLKTVHNFENMMEEWTFENYDAFDMWLIQEQKTNNVRYLLTTIRKAATKGIEKHYFECQGFSKKKPHPHDKTKIKSACASQIILKKYTATDECLVTYYRSHYSHEPVEISEKENASKPSNMINTTENQDPQSENKSIPITLDELKSLKNDDVDETSKQAMYLLSKTQVQTTHDSETSLEDKLDTESPIEETLDTETPIEDTLDTETPMEDTLDTETPSPMEDTETSMEDKDRIKELRHEINLGLMQIIHNVENNDLSREQLEHILDHLTECVDFTKT
ncbi:unnamed protein product [Ceutorhynchus assimilis]|uniref:C2H2-type domain-containing protein n=1 Tax=Ceutorhynchus assimilis TaxID=467358 RepID=A0A9N9ML39_9CUCU|nr:unnamed protein product [Ceutorhynchus assimilis]